MPIGRYVVIALLGVAGVVVLALLVRPFIFSFATARDDANYPVMAEASLAPTPFRSEVVLEESHGLVGEIRQGEHVSLMIFVTRLPAGGIGVVNAWSPSNNCAVERGPDRFVDCAGDAWTYGGFPISRDMAPLQTFPAVIRNGAVIVDFTQPQTPGS
jgi:hypothetical protein